MKSLERRQALIELLCERRYDKIDNLAFELGVSWRTICRDIQALSLSYPIYTDCSRGKAGVYVQEGYYLGKQYLHKEEAELFGFTHRKRAWNAGFQAPEEEIFFGELQDI